MCIACVVNHNIGIYRYEWFIKLHTWIMISNIGTHKHTKSLSSLMVSHQFDITFFFSTSASWRLASNSINVSRSVSPIEPIATSDDRRAVVERTGGKEHLCVDLHDFTHVRVCGHLSFGASHKEPPSHLLALRVDIHPHDYYYHSSCHPGHTTVTLSDCRLYW